MERTEPTNRLAGSTVSLATVWAIQHIRFLFGAIAQMSLFWWVIDATPSVLGVATAAVAALLPGALLGGLFEALERRWGRRRLAMVSDGLLIATSLLAAVSLWRGTAELWHVYAIMFVRSFAAGHRATETWKAARGHFPVQQLATWASIDRLMQGIRLIGALPLSAWLMCLLPLHWIIMVDVLAAVVAAAAAAAATLAADAIGIAALRRADHIVVYKNGRCVAQGTLDVLLGTCIETN